MDEKEKKIEIVTKVSEEKPKKKKTSIKATIEKEMLNKNYNAKEIVEKYGFKLESVRWYISQLKK